MTFKVFTNDRGKQKGVFMYSCYTRVDAVSLDAAQRKAETLCADLPYFGAHGPVKAVEWPPTSQASKDWFAKHVGA